MKKDQFLKKCKAVKLEKRMHHTGRPYRSFFSSVSAYHAKEHAYNYIVQQIETFSDNEHLNLLNIKK